MREYIPEEINADANGTWDQPLYKKPCMVDSVKMGNGENGRVGLAAPNWEGGFLCELLPSQTRQCKNSRKVSPTNICLCLQNAGKSGQHVLTDGCDIEHSGGMNTWVVLWRHS